MPIDEELRKAVRESVANHGQPDALTEQLISLLNELSAGSLSDERKNQRINLLIQAVTVTDASDMSFDAL